MDEANPAASVAAPEAAAAGEAEEEYEPRPQSRRIRTCVAGINSMIIALFAPCTPEQPQPKRTVMLDKDGHRLGHDGKPVRLARKVRAAATTREEQAAARQRLLDLKIDLKSGPLQYLSPARLAVFESKLDPPKQLILRKAGEALVAAQEKKEAWEEKVEEARVAPKSVCVSARQEAAAAEIVYNDYHELSSKWNVAAHALAATILKKLAEPVDLNVALPWPTIKGKGNKQGGTVMLRVKQVPYSPEGGKTRRPGKLMISIQTEKAAARETEVKKCIASMGHDNCLDMWTPEGNVLIWLEDEPSRWTYLLGVNAGLHLASASKIMMDQCACTMEWHNGIRVEESND